MAQFSFEILSRDKHSLARAGIIKTSRGDIETPYFVPVATRGEVIGLTEKDLESLGVQCALVNTYHLHLRKPGDKEIKKKGGVHKIMKFNKTLFSDSGGFQVFSLGDGKMQGISKFGVSHETNDNYGKTLVRINNEGVYFISVYDNKEHFLNPEKSMKIQSNLGTDIIMAFDECTSPLHDYQYTKKAMERTHKWALESLKYKDKEQALYGIIQGGLFEDLRKKSTEFILRQNFEGIAIGGAFVKEDMATILDWIKKPLSNDGRPIHFLGIGAIDDIFSCVERGSDTFDCVIPTRNARHGHLFISPKNGGNLKNKFKINIENSRYKDDNSIIEEGCGCFSCSNKISRAKLRKLYKEKSKEYVRLSTIHNLYFMLQLLEDIRHSIKEGKFSELKKNWLGK